MHPFTSFKKEQTALEIAIREAKAQRKPRNQSGKVVSQSELHYMRQTYRYRHIAYCEARGRVRIEIEQPGRFNLPDEDRIKAYKANLLQKVQEHESQYASIIAEKEALRRSA